MALGNGYYAVLVHVAWHFHHEVFGEVGYITPTRHVDRPDLLAVVKDGVHDIYGQFQLVYAPARAFRVQLWLVGTGLLTVVGPIIRDGGHNVLGPRGAFRLQLGQYLVFEIIILEVFNRDRFHDG